MAVLFLQFHSLERPGADEYEYNVEHDDDRQVMRQRHAFSCVNYGHLPG